MSAIDARMGQIYYGLYAMQNNLIQQLITPGLIAPQQLFQTVNCLIKKQLNNKINEKALGDMDSKNIHPIIGVGSGWDNYVKILTDAFGPGMKWIPNCHPNAAGLSQLAMQSAMPLARPIDIPAAISPLELRASYVRDQVAAMPK